MQEIGTNAVRYATGGGCLHWSETLGEEPGLELFYVDKGPGIYDLERALRDGVSSGGSLGTGFGAMRRLLDEFDVFSTVKGTTRRLTTARRTTYGTALLGRKWVAPATPRSSASAPPRDAPRRRLEPPAPRRGDRTATPTSSRSMTASRCSRSSTGSGTGAARTRRRVAALDTLSSGAASRSTS